MTLLFFSTKFPATICSSKGCGLPASSAEVSMIGSGRSRLCTPPCMEGVFSQGTEASNLTDLV